MTEAELNVSNKELLQKPHLIIDGKLKRSAVLLFYHDPEVVQNGSIIKVGKFDECGLVVYHHDLEESLIVNAHKVIDLIYMMYLKAKIGYEHDMRVEEYPFAREAIREAIYNAIAHNCYMYGTPIQIKVTEEDITISNQCILPENWTVETLMEPHDSKPYNPDIARVFYRAGFIENWGQGIQKICDECRAIGAEIPTFELIGTTLRIQFKALQSALIDHSKAQKHQSSKNNGALEDEIVLKIVTIIRNDPTISQDAIAQALGITRRIVQKYISLLKENGRITRLGGKRYGHWQINE